MPPIPANDFTLKTTAKNVVQALNELFDKISGLNGSVLGFNIRFNNTIGNEDNADKDTWEALKQLYTPEVPNMIQYLWALHNKSEATKQFVINKYKELAAQHDGEQLPASLRPDFEHKFVEPIIENVSGKDTITGYQVSSKRMSINNYADRAPNAISMGKDL